MSDVREPPVWKRDEPDSPCLNVCVQHPGAGICIGCFRTPREVAGWARLTREERLRIRSELPEREALLTQAGSRPSRLRKMRRRARSGKPGPEAAG